MFEYYFEYYFGRERVIFFKVQLCTDAFLRRKAVEKPFAAQTPPRKRGYVEDFALNPSFLASIIPTNVTALLLRYVHVTFGEIAARQARGWGGFLSNDLVDIMLLSAVSRFCKRGSVRFSAELYSYLAKHKTNYL